MEDIINHVMGKAALTGISGAATTYTTSNAFNYSMDGKSFTKAGVSGGTTPTTDAATSAAITLTAGYGTVVVWGVNAAGTVQVRKGSTEALDGSNFNVAPQFPTLADTFTPFAYTIHKAGSTLSGTFTFGTSNWNTTGMTHTVVDITRLPSRPQIA